MKFFNHALIYIEIVHFCNYRRSSNWRNSMYTQGSPSIKLCWPTCYVSEKLIMDEIHITCTTPFFSTVHILHNPILLILKSYLQERLWLYLHCLRIVVSSDLDPIANNTYCFSTSAHLLTGTLEIFFWILLLMRLPQKYKVSYKWNTYANLHFACSVILLTTEVIMLAFCVILAQ